MAELAEEHGGSIAAPGTASRAQRAAAAVLPDAHAAVTVLGRLRAELPGRVGPASADQAVRAAVHVGPAETNSDPARQTVAEALWLVEQVTPGQTVLTEPAATQLISRLGRAHVMVDLGLVHLPKQRRPERVFGLGAPGAAAFRLLALGAARASDAPTNLALTPVVGRDVQLADLVRLVVGQRICTVTGAPGIGKSSVAQECAAHAVGGFPDGVWQVDLRTTPDTGEAVARAVLAVSGGDTGSGTLIAGSRSDRKTATARLVRRLRARAVLLLLDNCDGALAATADVIRSVVDTCPGVHVLVTSRAALGLEDEAVQRLAPLSLPSLRQTSDPGRAGSVELLVHLLTRDRPGLALGADDLDAVADICTLVDGVPLAIELAAARFPGLGLREIADSLRRLGSPLAAEDATKDALAWTTRSLPQPAQQLLRRLSVFAGGFSADAAAAVCGDGDSGQASVADALAVLVAQALVETDEASGSVRYRLLSATRDHASRSLVESGEASTLVHRHARWFADVAATAEAGCRGPDQLHWLDVVDADLDNLSAALDASVGTRQADQALWTAARLGVYWLVRGRVHEGRSWLTTALSSAPSEPSPARSWAWCATGLLACFGGDPAEAVSASAQAIRDARACAEPGVEARSSSVLGLVAAGEGRMGEAERLHRVAVRTARDSGDDWAAAFALANLGNPLALRGDTRAARACSRRAWRSGAHWGDRYGISWSWYRLRLPAAVDGRSPRGPGLCSSSRGRSRRSCASSRAASTPR